MATVADEEKQLDADVVAVGSDSSSQQLTDKALERKLVWKTDLILMPALGMQLQPASKHLAQAEFRLN